MGRVNVRFTLDFETEIPLARGKNNDALDWVRLKS